MIFSFDPDDRFKIIEKYTLRKRENGKYIGCLYNEVRGILHAVERSNEFTEYRGNFYIFEETKRDTRLLAKKIDEVIPGSLKVTGKGFYIIPENQVYPLLRNFPLFSNKGVKEGDKWQAFGTRIVNPERDNLNTSVRFLCEYRYDGVNIKDGETVHVITAQYAMRYKIGEDPYGDPALLKITGKHLVSIFIPENKSGTIFIRDSVDEQYFYIDGRELSFSGFILTWYDTFARLDRTELVEEITEELAKSGIKEVEVKQQQEGVTLSIQNIHFIPDSPEILPQEKGRLDNIAEILKTIKERTFFIIGHTADIGTKESQYELSVRRAKTIVDNLVLRGIPADSFLYEGRGGKEPVAPNDTEENRAKNRRVEIIILED